MVVVDVRLLGVLMLMLVLGRAFVVSVNVRVFSIFRVVIFVIGAELSVLARSLRRRSICNVIRRRSFVSALGTSVVRRLTCAFDRLGDNVILGHRHGDGHHLDGFFALFATDLLNVLVFLDVDDVRGFAFAVFRRLIGEIVISRWLALYALRSRGTGSRRVAPRKRLGTPVGRSLELGFRSRLFIEKRLPVGDWDLIIVRVDFVEGQESVSVPAVVNEGSLE